MIAHQRLVSIDRSAARTHVGRVRFINEDRLLDCPDRGLWAVADGMGGHSAGDAAATAAIAALVRLANSGTAIDQESLLDALIDANAAIYDTGARHGGMSGSTIAGLTLDEDRATVFWMGDSRVYRLRGGRLTQLTHDHSLVQELVDAGALTEEQARHHPRANVITRALGIDAIADTAFATSDVTSGDRFLLCSDGLSALIDAAAIASLLAGALDEAADALISAAIAAGGHDNVTVIVVDA